MAKYLDPKNDLIFKKIFGEHPHLLISFLNAIMPFENDRHIEEIHYLPAEQVPDIVGKKNSIVDVKCVDNYKNIFIVEMQMYWTEAFNKRMLFNAGKAYVRQLNKNEDYNLLNPVYTLALINDTFDHKTNNFYHYHQIVNKENTDEIIDGLSFVLIELPKFCPKSISDRKLAVLWLRFLSEVDEDTKNLPSELANDANIFQAAELCEESTFTESELAAYEAYWDAVRIEKTLVAQRDEALKKAEQSEAIGIQKGEAIGLEKGKIEGKLEGKLEIAKNLKTLGLSLEQIAKATDLTIEELLMVND